MKGGVMQDKLSRIKAIGFILAGHWKLTDGVLALDLQNYGDVPNVLYAFIVDDQLMYIGKTVKTLSSRMAGYKTPGPSQRTNKKNNANICHALEQGKLVQIYVLPDNGLLYYGGFHVNVAAALEDSLIRDLAPPWNGGQKETSEETLEPAEPAPQRLCTT
jgi:hypothetical protein